MKTEDLLLYTILDKTLTELGGLQITDDMRLNGVLLRPSFAEWFIANRQITLTTFADRPNTVNAPLKPVMLSSILAPVLTKDDDGKFYMMQAMQQQLKLTTFDPKAYDAKDDPGDLTLIFDNGLI